MQHRVADGTEQQPRPSSSPVRPDHDQLRAMRLLHEHVRGTVPHHHSLHPHHGPTATFNDFKALVPDMKIDYVFVAGRVSVLQHAALSDTWDGRFPSDHLPVLAEVMLD